MHPNWQAGDDVLVLGVLEEVGLPPALRDIVRVVPFLIPIRVSVILIHFDVTTLAIWNSAGALAQFFLCHALGITDVPLDQASRKFGIRGTRL